MKNQLKYIQFLRYLGISFLFIFTFYFITLAYINPKQTFNIFPKNKFTEYSDNFIFNKSLAMERPNSFDTLIIGSSTSECFVPADVNYFLKAKTFSASTGGGNTITRFALLKSALKKFPYLKRVIYVVDLFEFNKQNSTAEVILNFKLKQAVNTPQLNLSLMQRMKHILSHKTFESIFHVLKKYYKKKKTRIQDDGTTTRSMITSPIKNNNNFNSLITKKNKKKLMKQIRENFVTYSKSVLNDFKQLSSTSIFLFDKMNKIAKNKNIEFFYILAPYHFEFKHLLFNDPKIKMRYHDWISLFDSFSNMSNIFVYNPLKSTIATNPRSGVWRDGIHFNRQSCVHMLEEISKINK